MKKCFMIALMAAGAATVSWAQPQMTPDAPASDTKSKDAKASAAKSADAKAGDAAAAPASTGAVKVEKIVAAAGVDKRDPVGEGTTFGSAAPVYCWTKLTVDNPPVKVKYRWSLGGEKTDEIEKDITTAGRWWTTKQNVAPGSWKCEVVSESGETLSSVEFTVTAAEAKPAAPAAGDAAAPAKTDGAK